MDSKYTWSLSFSMCDIVYAIVERYLHLPLTRIYTEISNF